MAEIKDCIGKHVKISKCSITIKNEQGKTCGVVRDITSLYDLQSNKQMEYYKRVKDLGIGCGANDISITECIIKDDILYVFRNIKSKLFHEKYGYIDDREREKAKKKEEAYNNIKNAGIEVIECIFV
jgi:hypothetical protein